MYVGVNNREQLHLMVSSPHHHIAVLSLLAVTLSVSAIVEDGIAPRRAQTRLTPPEEMTLTGNFPYDAASESERQFGRANKSLRVVIQVR